MALRDRIREGAAEVFGFDEVLVENEGLKERFVEANADARMLARGIEDIGWENQSGPGRDNGYLEVSAATRREDVKQAYLYYFDDPIVGRTVDLRTNYAFSKGVTPPKYRDDPQDSTVEDSEAPGQSAVNDFWTDPFNAKVLFGEEAQRQKATELQLHANIFLLIMDPTEMVDESAQFAATDMPTRLAAIPQLQIVDVIMHPGHDSIPLFYKRSYTPRAYDFQGGAYQPGVATTVYYKDWQFGDLAPTQWPDARGEMQPWGPSDNQVAPGRMYHIATNRTGSMKFGVPEVNRYIKWARGLNEYMHSRMNLVQALSQIAMRAKVRGGPRHVRQIAGKLEELSRVAADLEGATNLDQQPNQKQRQTRASVENAGVDLEPNVADTNSGNAVNDVNTLKSQVAAGSGVPAHHLGGTGDANLASATSMDAPLQRLCESDQKLWRGVYKDLVGDELKRKGLDPAQLEISMPPILSRDIAVISQVIIGLIGAVDPNVANRELVRWCVGQVLDAMDIDNTPQLLDQFFPKGWISPMEQTMLIAQMQAQMQPPDPNADPGAGDQSSIQSIGQAAGQGSDASKFADGMDQLAKNSRGGRRMAGVLNGPGNAIAASGDRAQARHQRLLTAPRESAQPLKRRIEIMVEAMTDGVKREDALTVLRTLDLPDELREVGAHAMAALSAGPDGDNE